MKGTKKCPRCKEDKPAAQFHWARKAIGQRQSRCIPCQKLYPRKHTPSTEKYGPAALSRFQKWIAKPGNREAHNKRCMAHQRANPVRYIENYRKRKYGLGFGDFDRMLSAQGGRCAVCRTDSPVRGKWCVDHCHESGEVRGVVCNRCNQLVGNARDSVETLLAAVEYLKNPPARAVLKATSAPAGS